MGALHPSKINHGYGPGGKTVRLAISTAVILKEEGSRVKNSAVNRKSVERASFFFQIFSVFVLFSFFVCLFVCLFV